MTELESNETENQQSNSLMLVHVVYIIINYTCDMIS